MARLWLSCQQKQQLRDHSPMFWLPRSLTLIQHYQQLEEVCNYLLHQHMHGCRDHQRTPAAASPVYPASH